MTRSLKKGPFFSKSVIKKVKKLNTANSREVVLTWSRATTIAPMMIGHTFAVHNGLEHIPIYVTEQMVGHKLGEFAPTRMFRGHIKKDKKSKR